MKARLGAVIALFAVSAAISNHVPSAAGVDGQPPAPIESPSVAGDWSAFGLRDDLPPPQLVSPSVISEWSDETAVVNVPVTELAEESRDVAREAPPTTTYNPPPAPTIRELVDAIFGWPGAQLVNCESLWNPLAVGKAGERGLFQIHPVHARPGGVIERMGYTWDQMFEVEPNIRVAAQIRKESGLRAWSCWTGG